jgi:hypothetical protein
MPVKVDEEKNRGAVRCEGDIAVLAFGEQEALDSPGIMLKQGPKGEPGRPVTDENFPGYGGEAELTISEETDFIAIWFSDPRSAMSIIYAVADAASSIETLSEEMSSKLEQILKLADQGEPEEELPIPDPPGTFPDGGPVDMEL